MIDIYVISLPDALERRRSVSDQLNSAGVDFEFFDAISGASAWRRFLGHDRREFRLNAGRDALTPEVGCYASHLALWHRAVAFDKPIVVLEDDFQARSNFVSSLRILEKYIERYGFVRLDPCPSKYVARQHSHDQLTIGYCRRYPHGAMGYAIAPRTAQAFIAASAILRAPVDKFIKLYWQHGQPLFAMQPAAIRPHPLCEQSAIESARREEPKKARYRLLRPLRKARWAIERARFNAMIANRSSGARAGRLPPKLVFPLPQASFAGKDSEY